MYDEFSWILTKVFIVFILLSILIVLTLNIVHSKEEADKKYINHNLIHIEGTDYYYDDITKVVYKGRYNALSVMFDADGTPVLLDEITIK